MMNFKTMIVAVSVLAAGTSLYAKDQMVPFIKKDCISYISETYEVPTRAIHVLDVHHLKDGYTVDVYLKADEPRLEERGVCLDHNGEIQYKRLSR